MASYYELLQVPVDASDEAIRKSAGWARHAVAHDPDRQRRLVAIDEAYETLRDPARRVAYAEAVIAGTAPGTASNGVALVAADAPLPVGERGCSMCGATPAANFPVVRLTGVLLWRWLNGDRQSYCREHGHREVANANRFNLTIGWLGLPLNLLCVFLNLYSRHRYSSLSSPDSHVDTSHPG